MHTQISQLLLVSLSNICGEKYARRTRQPRKQEPGNKRITLYVDGPEYPLVTNCQVQSDGQQANCFICVCPLRGGH